MKMSTVFCIRSFARNIHVLRKTAMRRNSGKLTRASRRSSDSGGENVTSSEKSGNKFDVKMLEYIVCPLSKQQLRYDASTNELINDDLQVAYPIQNGIPNLVPQDARMMADDKPPKSTSS